MPRSIFSCVELGADADHVQVFKYFDVGLTGRLDYNQFFAAMTRLNFVGVQVWFSIDCSAPECMNMMLGHCSWTAQNAVPAATAIRALCAQSC